MNSIFSCEQIHIVDIYGSDQQNHVHSVETIKTYFIMITSSLLLLLRILRM